MSNAAPQTGEPTMEEILASIRRIISEEEGEAAPAAPEPAAAAPEAPAPSRAIEEAVEEEDVLELTDVVEETAAPAPAEPTRQARPRPALVEPVNDIAFDPEPEPAFAPLARIDSMAAFCAGLSSGGTTATGSTPPRSSP